MHMGYFLTHFYGHLESDGCRLQCPPESSSMTLNRGLWLYLAWNLEDFISPMAGGKGLETGGFQATLGFHPFIKENHALMEIGVCAKMEDLIQKPEHLSKWPENSSTKLWGQPIFRPWSQAPQKMTWLSSWTLLFYTGASAAVKYLP